MNASSTFRWAARVLSVALTLLFAAFAIGEGPPPMRPLSLHTLSFGLLAICLAGLLLAWRIEVVGAALALVAAVGFYLNDFFLSGFHAFPGGWVFPLLLITPLLYVIAAILENHSGAPRPLA